MRPGTWTYAEEFVTEPDIIEQARHRGEELGCTPVGTGTGAALRMLAASAGARSVIEIGTGAGVSGLWLLAGMPNEGILTSIDISSEHQHAAKQAFAAAGYVPQRTRTIVGSAQSVLPRMTDGGYDLVLVDGDKPEYPAYVEQSLRLLRPGGVMAIDNMLWHDQVADPTARDEVTRTLRDLGKQLRDDDTVFTTLLPVGDGLMVCVKR